MNKGEIIEIAFAIVLILIILASVIFIVFSATKYWEIRDVIDICNQDFGEGNWIFTENSQGYSCKSTTQERIVSTNVSRECSMNGIKVNCEVIDNLK